MMRRLLSTAVFAAVLGLSTAALAEQDEELPDPDELTQQSEEQRQDSSNDAQARNSQSQKAASEADDMDNPTTEDTSDRKADDNEDRRRSLFDRGQLVENLPFTGFGGPELKLAEVVGNTATFVGGRAGLNFNDTFVLGAAAYGLASSPSDVPEVDGQRPVIGMGYGGVLAEGLILRERILQFNVGGLLGFGNVSYRIQSDSALGQQADDGFLVTDLYGGAELTLTDFLQTGLGVGYRFTFGADLPGLQDSSLSSPTVRLAVTFGNFD